MELSVTAHNTETTCTLTVVGEVDVSCADSLRQALNEALAGEAPEIVVDLSEVPYIDSTGIGVLVGAAHNAQESGKTLVCKNPQRNVERVLNLLGVDAELNVQND